MSKCLLLRQHVILLSILSAALLLAHIWLIAPILQNGDAAVYCEQIEHRIISVRTTHIGYMLLGIVAHSILPLDVVRSVNLMSLVCACVGAFSLAFVARGLGAPAWIAWTASILVLGLRPYLYGAVLSEVDVPACSFVLAALAAWCHGRPVLAGIAFGVAMLVTPISALSLPLFVLGWSEQDEARRWLSRFKRLAVFAAASTATYLPLVVGFWQEYWSFGRGMLNAPRQPWSLLDQLSRSLTFFEHNFGVWLLLAVAGLARGLVRRQPMSWGLIASSLLTAIVGERFLDVPVQLPNLCMLAAFAVSSVAIVSKRAIAGLLLCIAWIGSARTTYPDVFNAIATRIHLRGVYLEMARQTPKLIVAGVKSSWDDGLPFEYIVYGKTKLGLGLDTGQFESSATTIARKRADHAIWVMSPIRPVAMAAFARGWRHESRASFGQTYDVWIPIDQ